MLSTFASLKNNLTLIQATVILNPHQWLYKHKRLLNRGTFAPAISQILMKSIVQCISKLVICLDDILIIAKSESEHFENVASDLNNYSSVV